MPSREARISPPQVGDVDLKLFWFAITSCSNHEITLWSSLIQALTIVMTWRTKVEKKITPQRVRLTLITMLE